MRTDVEDVSCAFAYRLVADKSTDDPADEGCACSDHAGATMVAVVSAMVVVHDWWRRGRRMVVMRRCPVVHWRIVAHVVMSAARSGEAGSRECQAGKDRSEGFGGLVHITPSLSFLVV